MVRTRLLSLALAFMASASSVTVVGLAAPFLAVPAAAQAVVDERPASELSDVELRQRFLALRKALSDPEIKPNAHLRLQTRMNEDRAEIERRRSEAARQVAPAPQVEPQTAPQGERQQAAPERRKQPEQLQAAPERKRQPEQLQVAPLPDAQPDQGPAAPSADDQQRSRRPGDRRQQAQPQKQQAPDRSARQTREGDRRAQEILSDRRDARQMRDDLLRQRLDFIREVLGSGNLSDRYERALLELLDSDRTELRSRVRRGDDRQRADRGRYGDDDGDRRDVRQLLRDNRPSARLSNAELAARGDAVRDALEDRRLRPEVVAQLRAMLESDRRELRNRLRAERDDRRRDLRRKSQAGGLRIEIGPGVRPAPRRSIAAAEVDALAIERQLVAPPTRPIQRRYSFEEYARRPELRDVMPGIELDTIHFGFNEYFVREEEVDELQRIGEIIERILAANPGEVFVVEGHTDAVGSDAYNYDLSRKRAEAVRDALLQYFVIEPGSIETIGYGERYLKIPTEEDEAENRRVTVRRITPILQGRR